MLVRQLWVKGGKSQSEQIFSALHQKAVTYASATASTGLRLCRRACRGGIVEEGEEVIAVTDCRVKSALRPICRTYPEEERPTIIHSSLDRHYRNLLDQPIPMLGNKLPRAAANTAKGSRKSRRLA
jgi:hypothetical protein